MDAVFSGTARYQVIRSLGRGGMGVVYEALDRERDQRVALKTMRRLEPQLLIRFKQEFRALKGLDHPNLVTFFDLVAEGGNWFITMELVEGAAFLEHVRARKPSDGPETLRDDPRHSSGAETVPIEDARPRPELPSGWSAPPYDEDRLRDALAQLAEGLVHLHAAGKVHRDIKPSNVMVTPAGRVVLLDFGLVADLAADRTSDSSIVGTAEYMAPEQAVKRNVGPPSDCYAVGVMLYEVLTGRLPFVGTGIEVLQTKLGSTAPAPSTLAPCSADLDALCVDLLAIDAKTRPTAEEILRRLGRPTTERPARRTTSGPAFVGRPAELSTLQRAFENVQRGRATVVLVEGPSGVGKSALVRHFVRRLEAEVKDLVVLTGRYYEREAVPYRALDAIMDAVSRFLAHLPPVAAEAFLPVDAGLLATLFPSLRGVEAISRQSLRPPALDPQELRNRVQKAVRELFVRLSCKRPLAVLIDDVQWSDRDSRAVLAEVMRPPDGPALLALTTLRTNAADPGSPERARAFLGQLGELVDIELGPLAAVEARTLAARLLGGDGSAEGAAAIAEEAQGHPLFIDALARHALSVGASSISGIGKLKLDDALGARVDEQSGPARQLLELVAVAGRPLPEWQAQRALALDVPTLAHAVSSLRLGHLVRMTRWRDVDAVEPYHDRVRELVAHRLDAAQTRGRHEQLARVLESAESSDAEALFAHWRGAGDAARSMHYGTLAAARAAEVLAFDRAARLYRELVDLAAEPEERRRLRVKLGEALANAGRGPDAAGAFLEAVPGASANEALELRRRGAEQLLRSGRIDEGLAAVRDVLAAVGLKMPKTPRRALVSLLVRRGLLALRGSGFKPRDAGEVRQSALTRIDICWSVAGVLGMVDTIRGAHFQTLHLWLALRAGERFRVTRALALEAAFSAASGVPAAKRTAHFIARAEELTRGSDDPYVIGWVRGVSGVAAALEGRWLAGYERCREAEEIFRTRCGGVAWELGSFQFFLIYGLAFLGRIRELVKRVPETLRDAEERGDRYAAAAHRSALANMAWLAADDVDGARARVREAMAHWSRRDFQVEHFWEMLADGQSDLYAGDGAAAHERVGRAWPALSSSLLLRVQLSRIEAMHLRGRAALALARGTASGGRGAILDAARRATAKVSAERTPWSTPLAQLLAAGIRSTAGESEPAATLLRRAANGLAAADMALYAAAARHRLGTLLGGDEGRALTDGADAWMRAECIVRPDRMVGMLVPGF